MNFKLHSFHLFLKGALNLFVLAMTVDAFSGVCSEAATTVSPQLAGPIGVSLNYAPTVVINGSVQEFPQHVLIEVIDPQTRQLVRQVMAPYLSLITGIQPFGKRLLHDVGLNAIYPSYDPAQVPHHLNVMVQKAEALLPLDRVSTLVIGTDFRDGNPSNVWGMARIFDATLYSRGVRQISRPYSALEIIRHLQGRPTAVVEVKRTRGLDVYEFGKYYINRKLKPAQRQIVRQTIFHWYIDFIQSRGLERLKSSHYFAHVSNQVTGSAFQRDFLFQPANDEPPDLTFTDFILEVQGDVFYPRLLKLVESKASLSNETP